VHLEELKDRYDAEKQIVKALPKMSPLKLSCQHFSSKKQALIASMTRTLNLADQSVFATDYRVHPSPENRDAGGAPMVLTFADPDLDDLVLRLSRPGL
jgi:hypothetical protein